MINEQNHIRKIAGKSYPMSFSLGASKKIIGKYGNAEKMKTALEKSKDTDKIDLVTEMIELLTAQGCAYMNYFEKDMPKPDDAPVVDGKWSPLPKEAVEIAVGISDVDELVKKSRNVSTAAVRKRLRQGQREKTQKADRSKFSCPLGRCGEKSRTPFSGIQLHAGR